MYLTYTHYFCITLKKNCVSNFNFQTTISEQKRNTKVNVFPKVITAIFTNACEARTSNEKHGDVRNETFLEKLQRMEINGFTRSKGDLHISIYSKDFIEEVLILLASN